MSLRRGAIATCVAVVLLLLAWRIFPSGSPPIYDGVCTADAYRLIGRSPGPSSAAKTYPAHPAFPPSDVRTDETPAQAEILLMMDSFKTSSASVTVSVKPAVPPNGLVADGNAYRIVATDTAGTDLHPGAETVATVLLRATAMNPIRTMYVFDRGGWERLSTLNAGCGDTFEALSPRLGYFALMYAGTASTNVAVWGIATLAIAMLGLAVFGLARKRSH